MLSVKRLGPLLLAILGPTVSASSVKLVSLQIPTKMSPPGGIVQMKLMVTEPTPISGAAAVLSRFVRVRRRGRRGPLQSNGRRQRRGDENRPTRSRFRTPKRQDRSDRTTRS